jgi:hypothetical protein
MSITVDEFLRLKEICEPKRRLDLEAPLTDELIDEAARQLPFYQMCRLEAVKNVPVKEWPALQLPRKDSLGNIKPDCVRNAVANIFWKLARTVEHVAREKAVASEPAQVWLAADGTLQCPCCGKTLALQKEPDLSARERNGQY